MLREEKRKIDGEASFMDVNDSFTEQFNGMVQNYDDQELSQQAQVILNDYLKNA